MKISVLITHYNRWQSLETAIRSAIQFCDSDDEILVSDDASPVNRIDEIIKTFSIYKNVRIFRQEENLGISNNYNWLTQHCTGDYVTYLDDDDYFLDNVRSLNIKNVIQKTNADIVFTSTLRRFVDEDGRVVGEAIQGPETDVVLTANDVFQSWGLKKRKFKEHFYINMQGLFFKQSIIKKFKFDSDIPYSADVKILFECVNISNMIVGLRSPVIAYINHSNSVTNNLNIPISMWLMNFKFLYGEYWKKNHKIKIRQLKLLFGEAKKIPGLRFNILNFWVLFKVRGLIREKLLVFLSLLNPFCLVKFCLGANLRLFQLARQIYRPGNFLQKVRKYEV